MRAFLIFLLAIVAAGGGWFLGSRFGSPKTTSAVSDESSDSTSTRTNTKTIRGQGKFEPASGLIRILAPQGERVDNLIEKPIGAVVDKDEVLLTLHSRKLREKDLELAKARRADALNKAKYETEQGKFKLSSATLAVEEANAADEKIAGEAQKIRLLEQQRQAAAKLLRRLQEFQGSPTTADLINQTDVDKQELLVEQLTLQIEQANLDVELAQKSADRAKKVAQNQLETAKYAITNAEKATPLESLNAAVEMAQRAYDMTEIRSPIENGTILDLIVREGDSVTTQPVMVLGDTTQMHCVVEINDIFLNMIQLQEGRKLRARITSTALKKPLLGTVISKGVMIGPPSLKDPNPFASVDRRTGTVTILLDDPETAAKFVNLQVEAEIEIEPGTLEGDVAKTVPK